MKKSASHDVGRRRILDSMIENDARFLATEKRLIRLLVIAILAFMVWFIYFIHIIQNYRLTPIIIR